MDKNLCMSNIMRTFAHIRLKTINIINQNLIDMKKISLNRALVAKKKIFNLLLLMVALICLPLSVKAETLTALSETFDDADLATNGWTMQDCTTSSSASYSTGRYNHGSSAHSGSYDFRFYYNTNPPQYLISKELSIPAEATEVNVELYYKTQGSYGPETFQVGYSTSDNDVANFTWDTEISTSTTSWTKYTPAAITFPVGTKYIAIKYTANNKYYLFIDDVVVSYEMPESCAKPTALEVAEANITATSAVVTWTKGEATSSILEYKLSTAEDWTVVNNATSPYELTGLTPQSTYNVRVKNDCGTDGQSSYLTTSFPTPCSTISTLPWTENFNALTTGAVPACWDVVDANGTGQATIDVYNGSYPSTSSNALRFNGKNTYAYAYALLPSFEAATNTLQIAFSHKAESATSSGKIELGYYKGGAFTLLNAYDQSSSLKEEEAFPLTGAPADARIAFRYKSNSSYEYAAVVDDITISEYVAPACPKPTALAVGQIGADSAVVTWTSEAATIVLQYKKAGDADWTDATGTIESPFVLKNLLPNKTAYSVRVKADCGTDGESDWVESEEFLTKCESVTFGWSESFDAETLSECWPVTVGNSTNSTWELYKYADEGTYSGYSVRFKGKSGNAASVLQTPSLSLTDKAALNFYWTNMNGLTVDVKVSTDGGTTKTSIEHSLSTATTTKKTAKSIDLSDYEGETVILYFSAQGNSTSLKYLYIDEVSLDYAPVAVPTSLAATAKDGGADVVWATDESGTWNLRYREYNAEPEANWTLVEGLTAKSKELTGLTNGTTYEVQVKTIASANRESDWTASATFTPVACASVTAVTLSQDTYENLNVNWTTTGTGTWELRYQQGNLGWSSPITNINDTYYLLEELVTGVPYSVEVKPSCGDDATWVAAAGTFTLTYTAPVAAEAEDITENSATVQWLRPADAPKCEYDFVLPGAAANWKESVALEATVDTLQAGTDYLFVVRSKYPTGVSEADTTEFSTITIAPKNLQLNGDPTTTSAAFTWTAQGMATRWQWSLDQTDWTTVPTAAATVDELEAGSSYTLYVRSLYDNGAYSAAISLPFQTACGVATLPFEETFGTVSGTKPNCWTIANWSGTAANSWYTYNDFAHSDQALRYNAKTLSSADAVSPAIELSKDSELKFYIKNSVGTGSAKVECKVLVNDGTETNELADITTRYTAATQQTFDLSEYTGKTVNLIFRGVGYDTSGSPYLWIDDVTVTEKPEKPTAIGNTEAGVQVMKTIENGQLIIIRDGIRYNAQGVLVK